MVDRHIPTPDDNLVLTRQGIDYLKLQLAGSNKGKIVSFQLGDSSSLTMNPETLSGVADTVVYTGTAASGEILVNKYNTNEVIIRCQLVHSKGDFKVGSIALMSDTGVPVFVGRLTYRHQKQMTAINKAGGRWNFQFRFVMLNIETYWDFSNLTEHYASMDSYTTWATTPEKPIYAIGTTHVVTDEIDAEETNRDGFVLIPAVYDLEWFSYPYAMRLDDANFHGFSGGKDGDGHRYVFS